MSDNLITIYTDGSCLGNPGPGGYAAILEYKGNKKEISGGYRLTTNNRMEILAAAVALESLTKPNQKVILKTDSRLLKDAISKGWLDSWQKKGWKKSDKSPVLNIDLWQRLLDALDKHDVQIDWVKAHAGNELNERCDVLAKEAAMSDDLAIDREYEKVNTKSQRSLKDEKSENQIEKKILNFQLGNIKYSLSVIKKESKNYYVISDEEKSMLKIEGEHIEEFIDKLSKSIKDIG